MDVLVVGAGVVGLAIGRAFALRGHTVIVAEAEQAIGTGVSSRSSEVIHAGMYYPTGSSRALNCVKGAQQVYHFCERTGVPHRRCGKLIVACDAGRRTPSRTSMPGARRTASPGSNCSMQIRPSVSNRT